MKIYSELCTPFSFANTTLLPKKGKVRKPMNLSPNSDYSIINSSKLCTPSSSLNPDPLKTTFIPLEEKKYKLG